MPPTAAPVPELAPLRRLPLTEYVPAAGLLWFAVAEPAVLARDPVFSIAVRGLLPESGLAAFASRTGVDLVTTEHAVVARFPLGTLYLANVTDTQAIEQAFLERCVVPPEVRRPHPELTTFTGVVRARPYTLVTLRNFLVAVATDDPMPARAVAAYALGRLTSPTVFHGASLSTLPPYDSAAPLRLYAAGPFEGRWLGGGHGLLGDTTALAITAVATRDREVRFTLTAAGEYGAPADVERRLRATWDDLHQSPLGSLLGLDHPVFPPVFQPSSERVELQVTLGVEPLVAGLHAAVAAEFTELFGAPTDPGGLPFASPN